MKIYAEFISRKRKRKNIPKHSEFNEERYFKLQTGQKINILDSMKPQVIASIKAKK